MKSLAVVLTPCVSIKLIGAEVKSSTYSIYYIYRVHNIKSVQ